MLIDDWKTVLKKAWSIRLMLLAGMLSGIEIILPLFQTSFPRYVFAFLSFVVTIAAVVARLYAQPKMHEDENGK